MYTVVQRAMVQSHSNAAVGSFQQVFLTAATVSDTLIRISVVAWPASYMTLPYSVHHSVNNAPCRLQLFQGWYYNLAIHWYGLVDS